MTDDHIGDATLDSRMAEILAEAEDWEDEAIRQGYPVAQTEQDIEDDLRSPRGDMRREGD